MNLVEVKLIDQETVGRYHFSYLIQDISDKYDIEIFCPIGSLHEDEEVFLRIYECLDYRRIHPDLNFILNLHTSLGYILIKNIDILRFDKDTISIPLNSFCDVIKPCFKVTNVVKW